ncbi:MAG: SUMF1/EgtB/PvdO family nonheme iron enzyme [Phycisphaerae bacterium]|nr:SUMF1/EgtB/PvdO family nonheme iron enzyme [Phycisphaerae bacterium]
MKSYAKCKIRETTIKFRDIVFSMFDGVLSRSLIVSWVLLSPCALAESPVYFEDVKLKTAVEDALWVYDPTPADMMGLFELTSSGGGIESLIGLEYASNLMSLTLSYNQISDMSPIQNLAQLKILIINDNDISDLSPLSGLRQLTTLDIHRNKVTDISSLSQLTALSQLIIRLNDITDITAMENLTNLEILNMQNCQVTDISVLAGLTQMKQLQLQGNRLQNLEPLASLNHLSGLLLHNNRIENISVLTKLCELSTLTLENNWLNQAAYSEHLSEILANNPGISLSYSSNRQPVENLSASTDLCADRVKLSWNKVNNGPLYTSYYQVLRSTSADGEKTAISPWSTRLSFEDSTIASGGTAYYWVQSATSGQGDNRGSYSDPVMVLCQCLSKVTLSSTVGGQVLAPGTGTHTYDSMTSVPIVAQANPNYVFTGWTGTAVDAGKVANATSASTILTMAGDYTLVANFKLVTLDDSNLYVDANAFENSVQDGTKEKPFSSIQQAIDAARDGETVVVLPGMYVESLNFKGKAVCVTSLALADSNALAALGEPNCLGAIDQTIVHGNYDGPVVVFESGEDANVVLSGFSITGGLALSGSGIQCYSSGPTISHCVITGNRATRLNGGAVDSCQSALTFINCTIADNYTLDVQGPAVSCHDSQDVFVNCIFWSSHPDQIVVVSGDDPLIQYCDVQGLLWPGPGNISVDPYFAVPGDYHLQSASGRYAPNESDPNAPAWAIDSATSPCIDLGDPSSGFDKESTPNGHRINMGAYGNTVDASRSVVSDEIDFVSISEGNFTGDMSRHEITNGQYCAYLNAALADSVIAVYNNRVYAASDTACATAYFDTFAQSGSSLIVYSEGTFWIPPRDGIRMNNHPVVRVSWYGAVAFCDYYGYRLPNELEWRDVADYDGSYIYGCGTSLDSSKANYGSNNPLGLTCYPYTSPVGYYPACGYGMYDLAGNVLEWTASLSGDSLIICGGSWYDEGNDCRLSHRFSGDPTKTYSHVGFRVCR